MWRFLWMGWMWLRVNLMLARIVVLVNNKVNIGNSWLSNKNVNSKVRYLINTRIPT